MNRTFRVIILCALSLCTIASVSKTSVSYAEMVNTMIGTKGLGWASGYTYPGATYPLVWYSSLALIFVHI